MAAGDGLCDEARRARAGRGRRPLRPRADRLGRALRSRSRTAQLALAREGAHSVRRVLHARDATGREIGRVLLGSGSSAASRASSVHRRTRVDALVVRRRPVRRRRASIEPRRRATQIDARRCCWPPAAPGRCSARRPIPPWRPATAWRWPTSAGARVADLEFVQFHPTALDVPGAPRFLLSEALRGEGARLVNADGERVHDALRAGGRSGAARPRLARHRRGAARARAGRSTCRCAHLDARDVRARFPDDRGGVPARGLDLARDPIPVSPAAHYVMGGVETDLDGRTSVPGLFAAGEVACTGVHGANRLASNSLLEGLVFGARAPPPCPGPSQAGSKESGRRRLRGRRPLRRDLAEARSTSRERRRAARGRGPRPDVDAGRARARRGGSSTPSPSSMRGRGRARPLRAKAAADDAQLARGDHASPTGRLDRARGAAARGEPRRPFPHRFPGAGRCTLEDSYRRSASTARAPDARSARDDMAAKLLRVTTRSSRKSPRSPRTFPAGTSTSSARRSWPTTRRSRAAWSSGPTATRSGSTCSGGSTGASRRPATSTPTSRCSSPRAC